MRCDSSRTRLVRMARGGRWVDVRWVDVRWVDVRWVDVRRRDGRWGDGSACTPSIRMGRRKPFD